MTSGAHDDGELGEVFLKLGKQGSTLAGVMDAFSIAVSIGLQYGVPLETYVSKFTNLSFEPAGLTDDADIRMAKSIMDYIFRRLALDYLDFETRQGLGVFSADERQRYLETGSYEPLEELGSPSEVIANPTPRVEPVETSAADAGSEVVDAEVVETKDTDGSNLREVPAEPAKVAHTSTELLEQITGTAVDSPLCMTCGTKMRPAGSCYVCEGCGSTSGCS
jgi:ribonucleoside-diphosphate reductase alpha chain